MGGQNSLLQAVYHAVPVLGIPLFGDQFDNLVRAETKGLGLSIKPRHITRDLLQTTVQHLIQDFRYTDGSLDNSGDVCTLKTYFNNIFCRFKSSALSLSRIHKSHPVPPGLRFTQWVQHILDSGGGAHLRPVSLTQPWYQRCLLDLVLLLCLGLFGPAVLWWTLCRTKNYTDKHTKTQ